MINSLKASIPFLADILRLNPHAIYERQRALVRKRVLESVPGKGPGSGTFFTPEPAAVLLISMLATDSIKDGIKTTQAFCNAPRTSYSSRRQNALGGALTFKAAIVNALSCDKYAEEIAIVRVHRMQSKAQILLERGGQLTFAFSETPDDYLFEGVTGFYQIMGNGPFGALVKIRALLRENEKAANANVATTKAPAKKRAAQKRNKA